MPPGFGPGGPLKDVPLKPLPRRVRELPGLGGPTVVPPQGRATPQLRLEVVPPGQPQGQELPRVVLPADR